VALLVAPGFACFDGLALGAGGEKVE